MSVDALFDAAKLLGTLQGDDPPPARFSASAGWLALHGQARPGPRDGGIVSHGCTRIHTDGSGTGRRDRRPHVTRQLQALPWAASPA